MDFPKMSLAEFERQLPERMHNVGSFEDWHSFVKFKNVLRECIPWPNKHTDCFVWGGKVVDLILSFKLSPAWEIGISWRGDQNWRRDAVVKLTLIKNTKDVWDPVEQLETVYCANKNQKENPDLIGALSALIGTWSSRSPCDANFRKWTVKKGLTLDIYSASALLLKEGQSLWTNPNTTAVGILEKQEDIFFYENNQSSPAPDAPFWYGLSYGLANQWLNLIRNGLVHNEQLLCQSLPQFRSFWDNQKISL